MRTKNYKLFYGIFLLGQLTASGVYAQTTDPRQIQYSPICTKTIINNTATQVVDPQTHRIVPRFGSTTYNINCQLSKQKQAFGTFFTTNSGRTTNYQYKGDGSVIVTYQGVITRASTISCTGCSNSVGISTEIGIISTSSQFSDCDNAGSCVCVPCPLRTNRAGTVLIPVITNVNRAVIVRPNRLAPPPRPQ